MKKIEARDKGESRRTERQNLWGESGRQEILRGGVVPLQEKEILGPLLLVDPGKRKPLTNSPKALPVHPVQPLITHRHVGGGKWTEVAGSPMKCEWKTKPVFERERRQKTRVSVSVNE